MAAHGTTTRDGRNHKGSGFQGQPNHGESTVGSIQMAIRVRPFQPHEDRDQTFLHGMEIQHKPRE
eukprot:12373169-Prorocentrum_lima.AAC.1